MHSSSPGPVALILATRNSHKMKELGALVGGSAEWFDLKCFDGVPEVEETAATFEGNAILKADSLARWLIQNSRLTDFLDQKQSAFSRLFVVADDSGLEVDVLQGAPGVHSARFAAIDRATKGNSSDAENNAKLIRLLVGMGMGRGATARFRCVLAIIKIQRTERGFELSPPATFGGACEGTIQVEGRGNAGFGYDPLFVPAGRTLTFAELSEAEKNQISHRAAAAVALKTWLWKSD